MSNTDVTQRGRATTAPTAPGQHTGRPPIPEDVETPVEMQIPESAHSLLAQQHVRRGDIENTSLLQGRGYQRHDNPREAPWFGKIIQYVEQGTDIGYYGALAFMITYRFFVDEEELLNMAAKIPSVGGYDGAVSLLRQIKANGYVPPKRATLLQWNREPDQQASGFDLFFGEEWNTGNGNVYREINFPTEVYGNIRSLFNMGGQERGTGNDLLNQVIPDENYSGAVHQQTVADL